MYIHDRIFSLPLALFLSVREFSGSDGVKRKKERKKKKRISLETPAGRETNAREGIGGLKATL